MLIASTPEEATTTVVNLDPTLLVFLSIFGAAALTAVSAFVLAVWQSHRDHQRWVREHRYDQFARMLSITARYARLRAEGTEMQERSAELRAAFDAGDPSVGADLRALAEEMETNVTDVGALLEEMEDVAPALEVIGPNSALAALNAYTDTIPAGDDEATERARDALVVAVRKALSIKA